MFSGCIFGTAPGPLTEIELSPNVGAIMGGEDLTFMAIGKSEEGETMTVQPEWTIVSGAGALRAEGKEAMFRAVNHQYEGDVVVEARVGDISAQAVITVSRPLMGTNPFPRLDDPNELLPETTKPVVTVGEPVDTYRIERMLTEFILDTRISFLFPTEYVKNGSIIAPQTGLPSNNWTFYHWKDSRELPEIPRLSHRVHWELINQEVLSRGTNYSRTVEHKSGTEKVHATEFAWSVSSETKAKATWGWGEVQETITATVSSKTSNSVAVKEETSVSEEWSFTNPNDADLYVYSSWNRVDTFYLSDSNGIPVDESPIFADYDLRPNEVSIRGEMVKQHTEPYNND